MAKYLDSAGLTTLWGKIKALVSNAQTAVGNFTINGKKLSTNPTLTKSDVGLGNVTNDAQVKRSEMGVKNGVATLDDGGKVPSAQLPSYVDDVEEVDSFADLGTGEPGKIYVTKDTNKTYRWTGSGYVEISASLALGETSATAYAGDKGKALATKVDSLPGTILTTGLTGSATASEYTLAVSRGVKQADGTYAAGTDVSMKIPAASDGSAGVMSGADKKLLDSLPGELLLRMDGQVTEDGFNIGYYSSTKSEGAYTSGVSDTMTIPIATAKLAGLLSPSMFGKLNAIPADGVVALTTEEINAICV